MCCCRSIKVLCFASFYPWICIYLFLVLLLSCTVIPLTISSHLTAYICFTAVCLSCIYSKNTQNVCDLHTQFHNVRVPLRGHGYSLFPLCTIPVVSMCPAVGDAVPHYSVTPVHPSHHILKSNGHQIRGLPISFFPTPPNTQTHTQSYVLLYAHVL